MDHQHSQGGVGSPPDIERQSQPAQTSGAFRRTKATLYFLSAFGTWKRRAKDVQYRASFPLLRSALRAQRDSMQSGPVLADVATEALTYAATLHARLILLLSPITLYTLFTFSKGLGILVRFGEVTTWLSYSVPLLIYLSAKLFVSVRSRVNIAQELERRSNTGRSK